MALGEHAHDLPELISYGVRASSSLYQIREDEWSLRIRTPGCEARGLTQRPHLFLLDRVTLMCINSFYINKQNSWEFLVVRKGMFLPQIILVCFSQLYHQENGWQSCVTQRLSMEFVNYVRPWE